MLCVCESIKCKKFVAAAGSFLLIMSFSLFAFGQNIHAGEKEDLYFPTYGNGKINVRLYTDYFCPPCQASEPDMEMILGKIFKKGTVRLSLLDAPTTRHSTLYAKFFLYAMKNKNSFANAMQVRQALFEAAKNGITDEEKLKSFLKGKNIAFSPFDTTWNFRKLIYYIKKDGVGSAPYCVIEKNRKTEKIADGDDILKALKSLMSEK
jgi:hypothetical protein